MRYYNKATKTELFVNPLVPVHLQYDAGNPDHLALSDGNPYFSPLPEGYELQYDVDNVPTVLVEIPDYWLDKAKDTKIDEVYTEFYNQAVLHGLPYPYDVVKQELDLRGTPPSPTADQQAVYDNVAVVDSAVVTINGMTTVGEVEAFDPTALTWSA